MENATLYAIDAAIATLRSQRDTRDTLPLEIVAPAPKTAEEASQRWLLAAVFNGDHLNDILLARPKFSVDNGYLYRVLVVARALRPVGYLTSTDLDGATEHDLQVLRAATKAYHSPGQIEGLQDHLGRCAS